CHAAAGGVELSLGWGSYRGHPGSGHAKLHAVIRWRVPAPVVGHPVTGQSWSVVVPLYFHAGPGPFPGLAGPLQHPPATLVLTPATAASSNAPLKHPLTLRVV